MSGYLSRLVEWLASVPILVEAAPEADIRTEIAILSERVFTRPETRAAFAESLLARSSTQHRDTIYEALTDLDYFGPHEHGLKGEATP